MTNSPLSFWKYSRAFFGYYVTSLIFSLVALKKLWRRSRKNAVMYGCYGVLSICEAIIAIYYAEGLWNYGMTRYVVWLAALCVLSANFDGFQAPFAVCGWKDSFGELERLLKGVSEELYKVYKGRIAENERKDD